MQLASFLAGTAVWAAGVRWPVPGGHEGVGSVPGSWAYLQDIDDGGLPPPLLRAALGAPIPTDAAVSAERVICLSVYTPPLPLG